jgi:hypothetical protein
MNANGNPKAYFIFSLDTELAWGYFDCFQPTMFSTDGQRERRSIRRLLDIFAEYQITATWAVVGYLFQDRFKETVFSSILKNNNISPDFEKLYKNSSPLLYGADVIHEIVTNRLKHEIAFHGYTHRIFDESLMAPSEAKFEIEKWLQAAHHLKVNPESVVFPRNQIGHLELFKKNRFICYRGVELMPAVYSYPLIGRLFRYLYDLISALSEPVVYDAIIDSTGLVNLPSSRWLFGFSRRLDKILDSMHLSKLRFKRILAGIKRAIDEKKIIHLWAHPYEFQTMADFKKLRYLLSFVSQEVNSGRLTCISMGKLAHQIIEERK